jgi:transcriptional regulator with XRE-family HTH domain
MTTLTAPSVYDQTLLGEPLPRPVRGRILEPRGHLWILGSWAINIPIPRLSPAPDVQRIVSEIRNCTGWSARRLADIMGTSHTTILQIENGRRLFAGHSGDLRRRLSDAHEVITRVFVIADREQTKTVQLLEDTPATGKSALDHLRRGDPAKAYLSAIDVMRPRTSGLLVGSRPRQDGATAPLHD